jgi:hypothetical protein
MSLRIALLFCVLGLGLGTVAGVSAFAEDPPSTQKDRDDEGMGLMPSPFSESFGFGQNAPYGWTAFGPTQRPKEPNIWVGLPNGKVISGDQAQAQLEQELYRDFRKAQADFEAKGRLAQTELEVSMSAPSYAKLSQDEIGIGAKIEIGADYYYLPKAFESGSRLRYRNGERETDRHGILGPTVSGLLLGYESKGADEKRVGHFCVIKYVAQPFLQAVKISEERPWYVSAINPGPLKGSVQVKLQNSGPITEIECTNSDGSHPTVANLRAAIHQLLILHRSDPSQQPRVLPNDPGPGPVHVSLHPQRTIAMNAPSLSTLPIDSRAKLELGASVTTPSREKKNESALGE